MSIIEARFHSICDKLDIKDWNTRRQAFSSLVDHYDTPGRLYHSINHIESCLQELDAYLTDKSWIVQGNMDLEVLELALLYHDVFIDILLKNGKNEEFSGEIASSHLRFLGVDEKIIGIVRMVIWSTYTRHPDFLNESLLMCDIDYSILGQELEIFEKYEEGIEYEYVAWGGFRKEDYISGRKKFLKEVLALDRIYFTNYFFDKYEKKARENVKMLLERLS